MGKIRVLIGNNGEIKTNNRVVNPIPGKGMKTSKF